MAVIGTINKLKVSRCVAAGIYVNCEQYGEIMIPGWDVTQKAEQGDVIDVFLLLDSDGQPVASMRRPLAMPGTVALLKVVSVIEEGALLEWGMPKNLFVPKAEQQQRMVRGFSYVVYVHYDKESKKIIGSTKLDKYLTFTPGDLELNQEVSLIIYDESELGYRATIDNRALGVIYDNDCFRAVKVGESTRGFVKNIREDGKVDLYLQKPGYEKILDLGEQILEKIKQNGGFMAITDKSPPERIYEIFGISKKNYKKAVGGLFKNGLVVLEEDGVRLIKK